MASKQETTTSIMSQIMNILESDEKELFSSFNSKSVEEFSESIETNDKLVKLGINIKKILNHFLSKKEDVNEDITKFTEIIIQKYNSILATKLPEEQLISPEEIRNLPGFTPNSTPQGPQGTPYLQSPYAAASTAAEPLNSVRQLFNLGNPETGGKKRKRRRTKKRKSKKKRKRKIKKKKRKSRKRRKRTKRTRRS